MRAIFLSIFLVSLMVFSISIILLPELYLHSAMLHFMVFAAAGHFLWKGDLSSTLSSIGFPGEPKRTILYTIAGLVAFGAALFALAFLAVWFDIADQANVVDKVQSLPLYLLVFAIVLAPISEELFFRALLVGRLDGMLRPRLGPLASGAIAIGLSSSLFGILHMGYGSIVEILGAGLLGAILAMDILYEIDGVSEEIAKQAFNRVAHKLPIKVRMVRRRHG